MMYDINHKKRCILLPSILRLICVPWVLITIVRIHSERLKEMLTIDVG